MLSLCLLLTLSSLPYQDPASAQGDSPTRLQSFVGFSNACGLYLLQPDPFGQGAEVLGGVKLGELGLKERFSQLLKKHRAASKNPRKHTAEGQAMDLEWVPGAGEE